MCQNIAAVKSNERYLANRTKQDNNSTRNILLKLRDMVIKTYIPIVVWDDMPTSSVYFIVRWPAIACLLDRFADLLVLE